AACPGSLAGLSLSPLPDSTRRPSSPSKVRVTRRASSQFQQTATATHFGISRANYCVPWSALCAQPVGERWPPTQGRQTAVVRVDTRAIGGTRRGPTRRERVRRRPSVQSLGPLDAWRTLRAEPWRKYRHDFTTTEERVRPAGGLVVAEEPTTRGARALRRPQVHLSVAFAAACAG